MEGRMQEDSTSPCDGRKEAEGLYCLHYKEGRRQEDYTFSCEGRKEGRQEDSIGSLRWKEGGRKTLLPPCEGRKEAG